jgi:hypothetical protein
MTITASIKRRTPTVNVKLNNSGTIQSTTPVTIQSSLSQNRIDTLQDVNASGEIDGATLVYESSTDKYIVKKLTLSDVGVDLDGGTF